MTDLKYDRYIILVVSCATITYLAATFLALITQPYWQTKEYIYLRTKIDMVERCDLGDVAFIGDSGMAVGIIPEEISPNAVNLALIGSGPIENYFLIKRILKCANLPKNIIFAFSSHHFMEVDLYLWYMLVRTGILSISDVADIISESFRSRDWSAFKVVGLPHSIMVGLPRPGAAFEAILSGRVLAIASENSKIFQRTLENRGYLYFGNARNVDDKVLKENDDERAPQKNVKGLVRVEKSVPPIINLYFRKSLGLLSASRIWTSYLLMPVDVRQKNVITAISDQVLKEYLENLAQTSQSGLRILNSTPSYWPKYLFSDQHNHLSNKGAHLFTQKAGECLRQSNTTSTNIDCPELIKPPI